MIIKGWNNLAYWQSGEYQVIKEKLDEIESTSGEMEYCPARRDIFAGLRTVHQDSCRVAVVGQDPYPKRELACGIAFSIPGTITEYPPTLKNIFAEYQADLGYPAPKNGDLTKWCEQGVLLWNAYPTCAVGRPGSHHWPEWALLTQQIVEQLDGQVVFVFLGRSATNFARYIVDSPYIATSHPSPLGANRGFLGSRIFTRVNDLLVNTLNKEPIDWRL